MYGQTNHSKRLNITLQTVIYKEWMSLYVYAKICDVRIVEECKYYVGYNNSGTAGWMIVSLLKLLQAHVGKTSMLSYVFVVIIFLSCRNVLRGYSIGPRYRFHWRWISSEVVYAFRHRRHIDVSERSTVHYACFLKTCEVNYGRPLSVAWAKSMLYFANVFFMFFMAALCSGPG